MPDADVLRYILIAGRTALEIMTAAIVQVAPAEIVIDNRRFVNSTSGILFPRKIDKNTRAR